MALPTLPTPGISTGWGVTINAYLDALRVQVAEPAGIIKAYGGTTLPPNTAWCDGSAVSRTGAYANLFAAIGTRYGAGNGSTTFNLPNLKGRTPVGLDAAQAEFDGTSAADMIGGEKAVALDINKIPSHQHDMSHSHSVSGSTGNLLLGMNPAYRTVQGTSTNYVEVVGWPMYLRIHAAGISGSSSQHAGSTGAAGNGAAPTHNNLQPYGLVNFVITLGVS